MHPADHDVYLTLTNSTAPAGGQGAARPTPDPNLYGHIIRWQEAGGDHAADFEWDIFLLAGDPHQGPARSP